jgi:hypothetical protein
MFAACGWNAKGPRQSRPAAGEILKMTVGGVALVRQPLAFGGANGSQCDINTGTVKWSSRSRLTPPSNLSRNCAW